MAATHPGSKDSLEGSPEAQQEARRCFGAAVGALAVLPMKSLLGCEVPELVLQASSSALLFGSHVTKLLG